MKKGLTVGYQEISHTADVGLNVWAPDLAMLFCTAADGMNDLMKAACNEAMPDEISIFLEANDYESLLVLFLSEILYQMESTGFQFKVKQLKVSEKCLNGSLAAFRSTPLVKEIKAVTFHNLQIQFVDGIYQTTIIFDV